MNEYLRNGVRYIFRGDQSANVETTFSKDLEPESVAIDQDDRYAYISLQVCIALTILFTYQTVRFNHRVILFRNH